MSHRVGGSPHCRSLRFLLLTFLVCALGRSAAAWADKLDLGDDTTLSYKLTVSYGLAIRTRGPSQALINGPIDPLQLNINLLNPAQTLQNYQNGTIFTHTGLPLTANFDDGDRNFKRWSLINNRLSGLGEIEISRKNYGFVASGDGFYDQVYHHPNDNNSLDFPGAGSTVNKTGPANRFTDGARYYDGQRERLLELYGYANWDLTNVNHLDFRLGKQLIAWGESLFFGGIASAMGPDDATKAFIPGAEVKDILLPVNQVSGRFTLTDKLTLLAYYHLDFKPTEIFPVGDFYSIQDEVGPGGTFAYGSVNPAYLAGCPGLLSPTSLLGLGSIIPGLPDLSPLCNQGGVGGPLLGAAPFIIAPRGPDIRPSNNGQYGTGLKYQLTPVTNVGLFYLRYADTLPAVRLNVGYAPFTTALLGAIPLPVTTQIVNEQVPTSYQVQYFQGIRLVGGSFTTVVGGFNVAGEVNYRDGIAVPIQATSLAVLQPTYTRGKTGQVLLSAIYAANPEFYFDAVNVVGEAGLVHVFGVDPVASRPGVTTIGNGQALFFSKTAWGFETLAIGTRHNVMSGFDLIVPISFLMLVEGTPSTAGSFGPLFGQGDKRVTIGGGLIYLDNLEFGLGLNLFLGDPSKAIRGSIIKQNPYADRDNLTFSIKYNLG